jgi:alpha-L-fucosidase 2
MRISILSFFILALAGCTVSEENTLRLWYDKPAEYWTEALPVGNGRLGAMVFGGVEVEHIQFNEETLWTGAPNDYSHPGSYDYLEEIRQLLFAGEQRAAEELAMKEFMSLPLRQKEYQPFGDVYIKFPDHKEHSAYSRELDLGSAICRTSYISNGVNYKREVIASYPQQVIAIKLSSDQAGSLNFSIRLDAEHEHKSVSTEGNMQILNVKVKDGALKGVAGIRVETNGELTSEKEEIRVSGARTATLWLSAATNFVTYNDVSGDPLSLMQEYLEEVEGKTFKEVLNYHKSDYQPLFNRFSLDLGSNGRDSIPTDKRLLKFMDSPEDPSLIALYTQFGRYLMISASRPGTKPSNLQGIWNMDMEPAWGSKYTVNINTEMNYWPAELTNLSECHEPLFELIEEISETGKAVARAHYDADGFVLHHNTDLWRGAAPINHSNHGIWVSGSGWLCTHLWEHFLFTRDLDFLEETAYPLMREAALFYTQFLIEDPATGWLISTPSNSPETGGLVAGPTMDHQIIRSLFKACIEAAGIIGEDREFADQLKELVPRIAPNQIGQYGQLQEWLKDLDDPENKHRHVSHLWGMHPGSDITWETSPELMDAAKQSLLFRGDEGTGWSLAWKINFWARLLDGDHAYELIRMQFRPVGADEPRFGGGGGSLPNLFDAHPPFQIDGNFGAPAGIVEMLIQSHQGFIDILPALPTALPSGSISGVCARGGFELSYSWAGGELTGLEILSKAGEECKIRYRDQSIKFDTEEGKTYHFNEDLSFKTL